MAAETRRGFLWARPIILSTVGVLDVKWSENGRQMLAKLHGDHWIVFDVYDRLIDLDI